MLCIVHHAQPVDIVLIEEQVLLVLFKENGTGNTLARWQK